MTGLGAVPGSFSAPSRFQAGQHEVTHDMTRTTRSDLDAVLGRIAPYVEVDGELMLHVGHGGTRGNLYQLRVRDPEHGGQREVGPMGYANEFEYFLRGVDFGRQLADGRYASDDE